MSRVQQIQNIKHTLPYIYLYICAQVVQLVSTAPTVAIPAAAIVPLMPVTPGMATVPRDVKTQTGGDHTAQPVSGYIIVVLRFHMYIILSYV